MTARAFPFAGLVIAHDATPADAGRLADLARVVADAGAAPVVAAVAPNVDAPADVRVVRTRPQGSPIAAIRLGMAQLTNTVAGAVLLVPLGAEPASLVALLALIDAAKRDARASGAVGGATRGWGPRRGGYCISTIHNVANPDKLHAVADGTRHELT